MPPRKPQPGGSGMSLIEWVIFVVIMTYIIVNVIKFAF